MPGLQQYQGTFKRYLAVTTVLEDYYSNILTFHHKALQVFNRLSKAISYTVAEILITNSAS